MPLASIVESIVDAIALDRDLGWPERDALRARFQGLVDDREQELDAAREDGHEDGFKEGKEEGEQEGRDAAVGDVRRLLRPILAPATMDEVDRVLRDGGLL